MKIFPTLAKDKTFGLSELASALELVCSQHTITQADHQTADVWAGYCPTCSHCVEGRLNNNAAAAADHVTDDSDTESNHSNSLGTTTSLVNNVAPIANVTAAMVVAPITPIPHVMAATTQAVSPAFHTSTSVSQCWYVIMVGCKTGIFQGWHNVHVHVIGVPGTCFGRYSSLSAAQAAYTQAEKDGSVLHLPL
ncbi:hypothetical protein DFH29DRAFT_1007793 [Suillus ampliporus]|nr:hypothetical protein DFH29DRAFT_1007793 [Suillus ampliporus]